MAALNTFRKKAVTVVLETKIRADRDVVTPFVSGALGEKKMGGPIPKLVVTSPDGSEIWGQMSYAQIGSEKGLKTLNREIRNIQKDGIELPQNHSFMLRWAIKGEPGYFFEGDFVKFENNFLHLKEKSKKRKINAKKLAPSALAYAKKMAAVGGQEEVEEKSDVLKPQEEEWVNTKGSVIKATFVSLSDEQITLKLASGKESTFALDLLSEECAERAKKYAE